MDLHDPTRAVTPTLDGPVLAVLAAAGRPMTVGEVAARTTRGSEIGVRRSLARLVEQGIVRATDVGRIRVHELNREHLAAPVAVLLSDLRLELWNRLRRTLADWKIGPTYACAFGSAARGDGGLDSDVDVLLVHPPFPGEKRSGRSLALRDASGALVDMSAPPLTDADAATWDRQVDELHALVGRWTGNPLQVIDISIYEWTDRTRAADPLFADIRQDAVVLSQPAPLPTFVARRASER